MPAHKLIAIAMAFAALAAVAAPAQDRGRPVQPPPAPPAERPAPPPANPPAGKPVAKPDQAPPAARPVNIRILAIRATRANSEISPDLRKLADKLKRQFNFTGFKIEKPLSGSAEIGKAFGGPLVGGYSAYVMPRAIEDKKVQLQVRVSKDGKDKLNVTATSTAGEFAVYMFALSGGDQLIVAVAARQAP